MDIERDSSVKRAERLIQSVVSQLKAHGVTTVDQDTTIGAALILGEVESGRDVQFHKRLLELVYQGRGRLELLPEEDCDAARAAIDVEYGAHVGDFLFRFVGVGVL